MLGQTLSSASHKGAASKKPFGSGRVYILHAPLLKYFEALRMHSMHVAYFETFFSFIDLPPLQV